MFDSAIFNAFTGVLVQILIFSYLVIITEMNVETLKFKAHEAKKILFFCCLISFLIGCIYTYKSVYEFIVIQLLIMIALVDIQYHEIPNSLTILIPYIYIIQIIFKINILKYPEILKPSIITAFIVLLIFLAINLLSNFIFKEDGIGMGDVKLYAALSFAYSGIQSFYLIAYTSIFNGIMGLILLLSRKAKLKSKFPLAPAVLVGMLYFLSVG